NERVEAKLDPVLLTLGHAPVGNAENLAPARELRCEAELPARLGRGLEDDDLMTALDGDPSRLEPGRAGTHHHDLALGARRGRDHMRHRRLAAGGGVVGAERLAAEVDSVDAVTHADARPDLALTTLCDLAGDVGVGDMGSRHADHIELT